MSSTPQVAVDAAPEVPNDAVDAAIHDVVKLYVKQVMNGEGRQVRSEKTLAQQTS